MPIADLCIDHDVWLARLADHLEKERYSRGGQNYLSASRRFCGFLQREGLRITRDSEPGFHGMLVQDSMTRWADLGRPVGGNWAWFEGFKIPHLKPLKAGWIEPSPPSASRGW